MPCIILSLWSVLVYHIFPHYLINGTIFKKKVTESKMLVLISLRILSEIFLIPRKIQRDSIINVHNSSCTVHPLFLPDFNGI